MRLLNSKKATELWIPSTMLFLIIFVVVLGFSMVAFYMIANSFISRNLEAPGQVEKYILVERFYNSPECFAYKDDSGRTYHNLIDSIKFKNNVMNSCISANNYKYAFKLELEEQGNFERKVVTTSNWIEGIKFEIETKNILVYSDNKIKNAKLLVYIQNA